MAIKEILVPDLGGAEKVDVIELNFKPGDQVQLDEGIVTLESDKATMEVPATSAGIIKEFFVKVGDQLSEGDRVASVETAMSSETDSANVGATGRSPSRSLYVRVFSSCPLKPLNWGFFVCVYLS